MSRHVLVVGPTGVVGGAIARRLSVNPEWQVTTAARRAPALADVNHLVYAAYLERPSIAETVATTGSCTPASSTAWPTSPPRWRHPATRKP